MKTVNQDYLIAQLAMELLDFCGGENPTSHDVNEWMKRRDYSLDARQKNLVMQTAEQFLEECKH